MEQVSELTKTCTFIQSMLKEDFDWEAHDYPDLKDEVEKIATLYEVGDNEKRYECGSYRTEDTAASMYRALWMFKPKSVDFSDMYKVPLFTISTPDKRFLVQFYLFKYELGLYFYAPKESIEDRNTGIWGGWPGADNDVRVSDPEGKLFFDTIKALVESEHMVYGGNNFTV